MNMPAVRKFLWIGAAFTALVWTLLTWGAYALVAVAGDALGGGAGLLSAYPEAQRWVAWAVQIAEQFGVALLAAAWFLGMLALVFCAWIGGRLLAFAQSKLDAR